jgi:ribosome biogenesis GTPase
VERVAIGDRVTIERLEDGSCRISEVLPRDSRLSRHSLAKRREQVLAANVDQVAVVLSVQRPEPDDRFLDRVLAVAELHELPAIIVINKMDLSSDERVPTGIDAYRSLGYAVIPTCAKSGTGLIALGERLAGRITVFTGPSGVGKTSIVNAILPDLELRVGAVGEKTGRGKHTTSAGLLIPLPEGGYLADTPGIQYFEPAGVDPADLAHAFPEFRPLVEQCRFTDCLHVSEPGCAVRDAVDAGVVRASRYASYESLLEAAEATREYGA